MLYNDQVVEGFILFELDEVNTENLEKLYVIFADNKQHCKQLFGCWEGQVNPAFCLLATKGAMADIRASGLIDNQDCVMFCFAPNRQNKRQACLVHNFCDMANIRLEHLGGYFQPVNADIAEKLPGWTFDCETGIYYAVV